MTDGHIGIDCECGGIIKAWLFDRSEPWNESPRYTAKCGECGRTVRLWIRAGKPEPAKENGHD
jgi:hypothetical protein